MRCAEKASPYVSADGDPLPPSEEFVVAAHDQPARVRRQIGDAADAGFLGLPAPHREGVGVLEAEGAHGLDAMLLAQELAHLSKHLVAAGAAGAAVSRRMIVAQMVPE